MTHRANGLITSLVLTLVCCFSLSAQTPIDLRLNGEHHAAAAIGSSMTISVSTTPNVWGSILFSANPGPTPIFGGLYTIPIGLDATTIVSHPYIYTGPSGVFTDSVGLIDNLIWEGITYYAYAYSYDASDPTGFGASNQAQVTFTRKVLAGDDSAGFVGKGVTLDGSAVAGQGPTPGNLSTNWSIVSGPSGHNAQLDGADTLFPTFTGDLPGSYDVELSLGFPGTTGGATELVTVEVFDLSPTSQASGTFSTADPVNFNANLSGPAGAALSVDGGAATMTGTVASSKAALSPVTGFDIALTATNGQHLGLGHSVLNNAGASLNSLAADALAAHLKQPILDQIETVMETALAAVNLSGSLSTIPPIPVVNTTFFTATATLQSFAYDPTIDVEMTFVAGAIGLQMTLTNVVVVFDLAGTIIFAPYMDTGTLTMATLTINFDLVPSVSAGMFVSTTANETATVGGATLSFAGNIIPSSQTGTILAILIPTVESLVATSIPPLVPPLVDSTLNSIPQTLDLSAQGVDITMGFVPNSVNMIAGSMTLGYNAGATANMIAAGTANLSSYFSTPSALPTYGATVPGSGASYQIAAGLADDFLNQVLAAALQSGAFEIELAGSFDLGGSTLNGDAGSFALAFPGLGFEKFGVLAPVTIQLHPEVAPIITVDNLGGMSNYNLHVSDICADIRVEVQPGYTVSVLKLVADATTGLTVSVNTMANTIDLLPGTTSASLIAASTMPGIDASGSLAALTTLINGALPGILMPVSGIPIPTLTGTTFVPVVVGIEADGPLGDYLSIFLN